MNAPASGASPSFLTASRRVALAFLTAAALVACGGGGEVPTTQLSKRALPADFFTRPAINYSPYRTSRTEGDLNSEVITPENVEQDMRLVSDAGFRLIRVFSSSIFTETVLTTIQRLGLDMKMQLGCFLNPVATPADEAANQAELAACIDLANRYPALVASVSVGNEKMVYWQPRPIPVGTMVTYIRQVRDRINQPVTSDDNWEFYRVAPQSITDVIDYAAVHVYPLLDTIYVPGGGWDWRQASSPEGIERANAMMDASIAEAKRQIGQVQDRLNSAGLSSMPIVLGETGWQAVRPSQLTGRAGPVNQEMYLSRLRQWQADANSTGSGPRAIFYFQAFDEPWKGDDDGWGMFTTNRQARCAVQGLNPSFVPAPGSCSDSAARFWIEPPLRTAVSDSTYVVYSNTLTGATPSVTLSVDAFDGNTALYPQVNTTSAANDAANSIRITPTPASFGWGLLWQPPGGATAGNDNLSLFSGGSVRFSIRTSYPGKLEVGISTDTFDRDGAEAFVQFESGQYGYFNDDQWHDVTIPLSVFAAANPDLDLRYVLSRFIIADRFAFTGKPPGTTGLPQVYVDRIHWVR